VVGLWHASLVLATSNLVCLVQEEKTPKVPKKSEMFGSAALSA
jgi:hypothetical protein